MGAASGARAAEAELSREFGVTAQSTAAWVAQAAAGHLCVATALLLVVLAEAVGFEPTMPLQACLISSQVQSTTLPCLRGIQDSWVAEMGILS